MQRFMLADVNEEQIMDKRPRSVPAYCLPHSPFRIKWDGLLLVLLTFTCISSPLRISMIDLLVEENVELARALDVIELIVDLLFVVDFILSFSFAYFDDLDGAKAIVRDPAVVFHHNRRSNTTYFCALALVPFFVDVITGSTISNGQAKGAFKDYVSLFGILRVFRLVLSARVFDSLNQFIASLGMRINAAMFRMIVLLFFFMMGVSITGCLYFFVACHPIDNTCKQTWLGEKSYNSSWAVKDPQVTERWSSQFSRSIYFSMQTLFTIGYGDDVVPVASSEIIVACVLMYLGQFAYACTIANMTSLMGNMDVLKMRFRQEMDALNRYMEDCSTPHGLRLRVKDFFEYLFQKQYGVLDSKITGSLPPHLSMEIVRHHTRLISKVPFFNAVHRSYRFVKAAASKLEARTYTPHSTIMFLREKQRELLIVTSGSADVYSSHSKQSISTLLPGDFIGDYQLVFGTANIVSVKSGLTFVDVLVLSHKCLYETIAQFDDEVVVSKQDPGVRVTIEAHQLRTERFSKLHLSMKKTTKNKKVMDMLENVVVAHDSLVILPSSTFHVYWDVTKLLALLYLCFMIPYRIMLQCDARQSDVQRCTLRDCIGWRPDLFVDYLSDIFFLVDIALNYRCLAFNDIQDGREVLNTSPEAIMQRYRTSNRFVVDVIGSCPVDLLGIPFGGYYTVLRMTHFARIGLLDTYIAELRDHLVEGRDIHLSSGEVSIAKNGFYILVIFHFIAVIWGVLHFRDPSESPYLDAMYWVVTTFTTVGYGDVVPDDTVETGAAIAIGVFGALFAAAVVANVTAYVHSVEMSESSVTHQKKCLKCFLGSRAVSRALEDKVMSYFSHLENSAHGIDEVKFLKEILPPHLQNDFSLYAKHKLILCVPMFEACGSRFLQEVVHNLQQRIYVADEWVVSKHYPASGMYIQGSGRTAIIDGKSQKVLATHGFGGYFGHDVVFRALRGGDGLVHLYSARTVTESVLWFLDPLHFKGIVEMFPESMAAILVADVSLAGNSHEAGADGDGIVGSYAKRDSQFRSRRDQHALDTDIQGPHVGSARGVLYPDSPWLAYWRFLLLLCNAWNTFTIPFRLAFAGHWNLDGYTVAVDYFTDFIFVVDVLLRSRFLAFMRDDKLEVRPRKIMRHYIRNDRVLTHLIAVIPLEVFMFLQDTLFLSKIQCFALLRFNKLFRIAEVPVLIDHVERAVIKRGLRFNKNMLRVAKLMCRLLIASHVFACLFFLIASWENYRGECKNWAYETGLFQICREHANEIYPVADAYIYSLYWAVATLTTVGYGDVHASKGSAVEVVFCTLVMIVGTFFIYTLIIANLEEIVAQLDVTQSIFKHRADKIREFCIRRKLPDDLVSKIDEYLAKLWVQQHGIRGSALLRYLPPSLHCRVVDELVGDKLSKLFFIDTCGRNFIEELATHMDLEQYAPSDFIFRTGQPAHLLFLMVKGVANLVDESSGTVFTTLKDCTLGEGEFFARVAYPCSCQLVSSSEMFTLSFSVLWKVLETRKLTEAYRQSLSEGNDVLHKLSTLALIEKVKSNLESKKMARMMMSNEVVEKPEFAVSPSSAFYKIWKIIALGFAIYSSISVPMDIAFSAFTGEDTMVKREANTEMVHLFIEIGFVLFFTIDLALHLFLFMCKHEGRLVSKRCEFRRIYVRRKMAVDVLSALPISMLFYESSSGSLSFTYSLMRLFQWTRVLRVGDYFQIFVSGVEEIFHSRITSTGVRRLIDWIPLTIIFNHWVACMFILISQGDENESWVTHWMMQCGKEKLALSGSQCSSADMYLRAFYWALYTLTTTGYGQVKILSNRERVFAMFVMVLGGVICDAGITAILTALFNEEDRESATSKRLIECTAKYLDSRQFGRALKEQVLDYFRYVDEELHNLVDSEVVSHLPPSLQQDLAAHFCFHPLRAAHILKDFPDSTVHYLVSCMEPYLAVPNEQLQCGHMKDADIFVLIRGRVQSTSITGETEMLLPGSLISNDENRAKASISGVLERKVHVKVVGASGLPKTNTMGAPDPFVILDFESKKHQTGTRKATRYPKWNEDFKIMLPSGVKQVVAKVMNFESLKEDIEIGCIQVNIGDLTAEGADVDDLMKEYHLYDTLNKPSGTLKLGMTVEDLKPWDTVQVPETTVKAVSFAQLYKLDIGHCTQLQQFHKDASSSPRERLPAPHRLGLSPTDGRRIINSCKSLGKEPLQAHGSEQNSPCEYEHMQNAKAIKSGFRRAMTEPAWKEQTSSTGSARGCPNEKSSSCRERLCNGMDPFVADVEATNLSTSDAKEECVSPFGAFGAYMQDVFYRRASSFDIEPLPITRSAKSLIERLLGLVSSSQVHPGHQ